MNSGVEVKMITGDHLNIAIETARPWPRDISWPCGRGDPGEILEQNIRNNDMKLPSGKLT